MTNDTTPTPREELMNATPLTVDPRVLLELEHRYKYHAPKGTQVTRYAEIRAECLHLAVKLAERVPASRELSTALTHLDAVMMYANAGIARNEQ
jgi:hypothetical protein